MRIHFITAGVYIREKTTKVNEMKVFKSQEKWGKQTKSGYEHLSLGFSEFW